MVMRKKVIYFIFTAVWHGMQFTCGSEYRYTRSVAFRYCFETVLEKVFAFLNSYFIVSKWRLVPKWNKSFFVRSLAAGQRGRSCNFQVLKSYQL